MKNLELTSDLIYGFVGSCLVKRFDGQLKTPEVHKEWWDLCCSKEKFVAIAAPRGHAKSTAITLSYTLANVLFRERKFVLLISDTESQACMFLGNIKQELQENKDIVDLFGIKRNEKGDVAFEKDSESDIIVVFEDGEKFRIMAKGSEQKLRGALWDGKRPDLIICDDLENDEIVMNKDRREKFRRWFYAALLPCRSSNGIIRYVGTILHMDSMLERLMPPEGDRATVFEELKTWSPRKRMWKSVKYKAHNEDFSKILWKEKFPEDLLKELREEYRAQGTPDIYSQEYLNIPIDDSIAYFKKADLHTMTKEDLGRNLNYYVAGDFAISDKDRADWTAIVIGGIDENGVLHIRNVIRDRLDGREIVDTLLQLQRLYNPILMGIEESQITQALGPFLRESMIKSNTFPSIVPLKPHRTDKIMRARSIQARMRAGGVKIDKEAEWYPTFEDELLKFPRGKHDDQVDAFAYLGLLIDKFVEAATKEEIEEKEYEEELMESGYMDQGRSSTTGY